MIIGRLLSIVSGVIAAFCMICIVVSLIPPDDKTVTTLLVFSVLLFLSLAVWRYGKKRTALMSNYKLYKSIMASNWIDSVENLATVANQPLSKVQDNIKLLQAKNLFLIFSVAAPQHVPTTTEHTNKTTYTSVTISRCKNCGASNSLFLDTASECEYCGSPLRIEVLEKR